MYYGSRGYQPNLGGEKSRNLYVGISLNLAEVLDRSVFRREPDSWWRKGTDFFPELVQIPGAAALVDIKL